MVLAEPHKVRRAHAGVSPARGSTPPSTAHHRSRIAFAPSTRRPLTSTPSARNRFACSTATSSASVPSLRITLHHGNPRSRFNACTTARAPRGAPARSATCPYDDTVPFRIALTTFATRSSKSCTLSTLPVRRPITKFQPVVAKTLPPRLLVVDDDLSAALRCTYSLLDAGFEVDIATTSADALRLLSERRYVAAVVDLVMPDLGGHQVGLAVRALSPDAALVVVGEDPEPVARSLAPDHSLRRPFGPDELIEALSLALAAARADRSSLAAAR